MNENNEKNTIGLKMPMRIKLRKILLQTISFAQLFF